MRSTSTLTFTNLNWDTAQDVTITGVYDDVADGDQATMIKVSGAVPGAVPSDWKDDYEERSVTTIDDD